MKHLLSLPPLLFLLMCLLLPLASGSFASDAEA